jgi:hypothetical protein
LYFDGRDATLTPPINVIPIPNMGFGRMAASGSGVGAGTTVDPSYKRGSSSGLRDSSFVFPA